MTETFRITLAQMNPTLGDLDGNAALIWQAWEEARAAGADLLACPEMAITGHPAEDLLGDPAVCKAAMQAIEALAEACADGPALAVGGPLVEAAEVFNACLVCRGGKVESIQRKHILTRDERRVFASGDLAGPAAVNGVRLGSLIGGDAGVDDVAETHAETGAELLLVSDASVFAGDGFDRRLNHAVARAVETGLPVIWLNLVGGQGDRVYDGGSFALNPRGEMAVKLPVFEEALAHVDLERGPEGWRIVPGEVTLHPDRQEQAYHALVLGLRDHLRKTGRRTAWVDMSGGTEAALSAVIAVDALGADRVRCVRLASDGPCDDDLQTAKALTGRLGCRFDVVKTAGVQEAVAGVVAPLAEGVSEAALRIFLLETLAGADGAALTAKDGAKGSDAWFEPLRGLDVARMTEQLDWRNGHHRDWMLGPAGRVVAEDG